MKRSRSEFINFEKTFSFGIAQKKGSQKTLRDKGLVRSKVKRACQPVLRKVPNWFCSSFLFRIWANHPIRPKLRETNSLSCYYRRAICKHTNKYQADCDRRRITFTDFQTFVFDFEFNFIGGSNSALNAWPKSFLIVRLHEVHSWEAGSPRYRKYFRV